MNIAPTDDDVWDPALFVTSTHVTPAERKALAELVGLGLRDVVRDRWPDSRVVHLLGLPRRRASTRTSGCASTWCSRAPTRWGARRRCWIDRQARKGKGPSDHAPVIVDLDTAPDGDIGPVIPPPSAPVPRRSRS